MSQFRFKPANYFQLYRRAHWENACRKMQTEPQIQRVNKKNFEELFSQLKLPFKLEKKRDKSKQFLQERLEKYPNGFNSINVDCFQEIWLNETDPLKKEKIMEDINLILTFYNNILRTSLFAPSTIPIDDMRKMLFKYDNSFARLKYVKFLFIREFDCWLQQLLVEEKCQTEQAEHYFDNVGCFDESSNNLQYGFWRNTLFSRYYKVARQRQSLQMLRKTELFGQPLVIDCSLEEMMAEYEIASCFRQISFIYYQNRLNKDPFKLYFTGYDLTNNRTYEYLQKNMSNVMEKEEFFFKLYSQSYRQLLPGQKFIYLSPDAKEIMTDFDHNAVYIIGALVSKTYKATLTLDKARQEGIQCLRLPIHKYVELKPLVKRVLSFRCVYQILSELKNGTDWENAFRKSIQPHKLVD